MPAALLATAVGVLGLVSVLPTALYLWDIWTTDALKSIGIFIPVICLVLLLRAWRQLGWEMRGTWWGLAVLALTILAVQLRDRTVLMMVLGLGWTIYLPPQGLVAFAYGSGFVLLFGGTRLFRRALFPLCLLLCVNPIPHLFNVFVDLPLQRVSAHVARGFAMAMGQKLSPDQLRLMFTPDFGMFIAPGCNGIRGAVTMGYIALVAGHLYRLRYRLHALLIVAAVLLGYLFNFLRLIILVLYYLIALRLPRLQAHAELADYIIGFCLFTLAAVLLFLVLSKCHKRPPEPAPPARTTATPRSFFLRFAVMTVLLFLFSFRYATGLVRHPLPPSAVAVFPQQIGSYTLSRRWQERYLTGQIIYEWAQYDSAASHIQLGISPILGAHDTLLCHIARGEDPIWQGPVSMQQVGNLADSFNASLYNDGVSQFIELTTQCTAGHCGEYSHLNGHFGFIYSVPTSTNLLSTSDRPIPILLHIETPDPTLAPEVARRLLLAEMQTFLAHADLPSLSKQFQSQ